MERIGKWLTIAAVAGLLAWGASDVFAAEAPPPGTTVTITGSTTLSWQAPTENVDGSPLTDLASYVIYFGRASRNYTGNLAVTDGATTNWGFSIPVADENDDRWFFAMTAIDGGGNESAYSNEVIKQMVVEFTGDSTPREPVLLDVQMSMTCTTDNAFWTCDVTWSTVP